MIINNQIQTKTMKTFVFFKYPFWKKINANGDGLFSNEWMVNMCHDVSPKDESCGILVFFHAGSKYNQWLNKFQNS
jgi:hypothetical protein